MKLSATLFAVCITIVIASSVLLGRANYQDTNKIDEFSGSNWESAMAHLDSFAVNLQNDPAAVGVVFVYGGQGRRRFERDAWSACIKDYLVKRRSIDTSRLVFVLAGYRENLTVELWQSPDKNHVPKPMATIKPRDVKFTGRAIRKWKSLCNL